MLPKKTEMWFGLYITRTDGSLLIISNNLKLMFPYFPKFILNLDSKSTFFWKMTSKMQILLFLQFFFVLFLNGVHLWFECEKHVSKILYFIKNDWKI